MCGFAGVVYRDGRVPAEQVLAAMAQTIAHRGPDGQSVKALPGCGLAHRRLAIIDLSPEAAQPMASEGGHAWLAFNGEIYNFRELRAELEGLGHRFRTSGDSEVVLAGYLQWGTGVFARLDGMFAIALWDLRTRTLLLAKDRTGKKPLFVYEDAEKIVFASEQKAIFAHGGIDDRENPEAVPQFLSHGYVPTPCTFYARIRKLKPATFEVHDHRTGDVQAQTYWDFPLGAERRVRTADDLREVEHELRTTFLAAVKRRLVSDVPLGAFLSGGVDSSLIVAAMAQLSSKPVRTFSIGFEGQPEWDETRYAKIVAQRYGTDHTELKVNPESFDLLESLAWHYDEPFGDSSCIPTYIVSKLTRAHVTVALTGDGGDELFCGYRRFLPASWAERIPRFVRHASRRAIEFVPTLGDRRIERVERLMHTAMLDLPDRLRGWTSVFIPREVHALVVPRVDRFATESLLGESYVAVAKRAAASGADAVNQVLALNARTYLLDDLNVKMDRASMAASLEARAPFLDTALMELAFRLPGNLKLKGRTTKWILKRAFADLLPEEIVTRPKMGFGVPLGAWFRNDLNARVHDELLGADGLARAYVRYDAMRSLIEDHESGNHDRGHQLWALLQLETWLRRRAKERPVVAAPQVPSVRAEHSR